MKRRTLLTAGAAAGALAMWPAWLAKAFDPSATCGPDERLDGLFDRYRAARRAQKPLLVLMIPDLDGPKWERGQLFGRVLNHGDDETLATLALTEMCCVTRAELAKLVALDSVPADAVVTTIDTSARPAAVRGYSFEAARLERPTWGDAEDYEAQIEAQNRAVDLEIAQFGALLQRAVREALPRVAVETADFGVERLSLAIGTGAAVEAREVLASARGLMRRAEGEGGAVRAKLIAALAEAMRNEVIRKPIHGSRWASSHGCGTTIEGEASDGRMYACGMGHVPMKSARFLHFFAKAEG
jgi:hypothetical protein